MAQKIIAVRLFTWFENVESPIVSGEEQRVERISHFGDDVDINDDVSLARGEELGAFFSDEDADAIRDGTYTGYAADQLAYASGAQQLPSNVSAVEGESLDASEMSSEELGAYINDNRLNVDQTVALATEGDTESIEKVYDAEEHAAQLRGNDARVGVTERLDALLAAAKA